jgi:hypothetical protein
MVTRIAISVALVLLSVGTSRAQDAWPGDPPIILIASQIDADGDLLLVQCKMIVIQPAAPGAPGGPRLFRAETKVSLKGVKIYNKEGNELTVETARKLLRGKDTAILASSWGNHQLAPVYRALFKDVVLLFVFPREAPRWKVN